MRVPFTSKMLEMMEQFEPYLVRNGLERTLAEDTPEEIRKIHAEFYELFNKRYREVWNDFNPEFPLPEN